MSLLYPHFLWLMLPLGVLVWRSSPRLTIKIHYTVLMLLLLALSRPVTEKSLQDAAIDADDIVIALDVSYSMRATDLSPTRYDFAKETIHALLQMNPADNIMLFAFTTNPLLLSPPTTDHTLIDIALESLNPEYILTKGTSLKKLFTRLASLNQGHKKLLLITDGGEEREIDSLANILEQGNLSLLTLALGSNKGTIIEKSDGTILADKNGDLVISRINPMLAPLTQRLGGLFMQADNTPEATAQAIHDAFEKQQASHKLTTKKHHFYQEFYMIPLLIALLLFLMVHTRAVRYLILILSLIGIEAEASFFDLWHLHSAYSAYAKGDWNESSRSLGAIQTPSLQSQMTLANIAYKKGEFKKAITLYQSIRSTQPHIKQTLYYNIATAYAKQNLYTKARRYYTKVLQLGEDRDTHYNLSQIALLSDQKDADLGIAHPKSQSAASSKSDTAQSDDTKSTQEDQPSSGSGSGGESKSKKDKESDQRMSDENAPPQPLGSKVYELINKGYIRETQPW